MSVMKSKQYIVLVIYVCQQYIYANTESWVTEAYSCKAVHGRSKDGWV